MLMLFNLFVDDRNKYKYRCDSNYNLIAKYSTCTVVVGIQKSDKAEKIRKKQVYLFTGNI